MHVTFPETVTLTILPPIGIITQSFYTMMILYGRFLALEV